MTVASSGKQQLRTAFKKTRSLRPLYTGGPIAISSDGSRIVACSLEDITYTQVENSVEICRFIGDTASVSSLCLSPSSSHLLVFTTSLSLHIFETPTSASESMIQSTRVISRAHDAPVHVCKVDPSSTYLASGSADGVVKVWDIRTGNVTHVFKSHGGVVSAINYHCLQDPLSLRRKDNIYLITASVDTHIRIFKLSMKQSSSEKPIVILEGHFSAPRGLDITDSGRTLVSGGRDSVVLFWDISMLQDNVEFVNTLKSRKKTHVLSPIKTIPILERVEALGIIHMDEDITGSKSLVEKFRFYTAGEKSIIKIWDSSTSSVLFSLGKELRGDHEEQRQILEAIYLPTISTIVSVHADQNILFHSLSTRTLIRQLIGYNDEIVDVAFLSPNNPISQQSHPTQDSYLAIATNSSLIRLYDTKLSDSRLLEGHRDTVLALDSGFGGRILASGSKDHSARIWAPFSSKHDVNEWSYGCVGVCEGHTGSVGAITFSKKASPKEGFDNPQFVITGSEDRTIKMWDLSTISSLCKDAEHPLFFKSLTTHRAHEKDVNALDTSPNDELLVSGSQDRTAKVYALEYKPGIKGCAARGEFRLIGTCKGHRRGVWTVRFGRMERILATGSGDKSIRLWSLDDFSCLKTFEGHTNSILRVDFINCGLQLVSSASDGLVKLWNIRDEECVATLDNHDDKVWALAISADEKTIVSGAADSVVTLWEDVTEEKSHEDELRRAMMVQKEQEFSDFLHLSQYQKAIEHALATEQPRRLLFIFTRISREYFEEGSITGRSSVDDVIRTLEVTDLTKLLYYVRDWNTNLKTSRVAQTVLHAIVKFHSAERIIRTTNQRPIDVDDVAVSKTAVSEPSINNTSIKELLNALIPYTERHLAKMTRLVQESYVIDYILREMDEGISLEI